MENSPFHWRNPLLGASQDLCLGRLKQKTANKSRSVFAKERDGEFKNKSSITPN